MDTVPPIEVPSPAEPNLTAVGTQCCRHPSYAFHTALTVKFQLYKWRRSGLYTARPACSERGTDVADCHFSHNILGAIGGKVPHSTR